MRLIPAILIALIALMPFAHAFENADEARAFVEKHKGDEMPDGYSLPMTNCSDAMCLLNYSEMIQDLPKAYKKNYQAQRNVAYCLWTGCEGAVQKNVNLGCAWNIVLLASGSPKITSVDVGNLKSCLSHANPTDVGIIKAQAAELYRVIYKRDIPADWR